MLATIKILQISSIYLLDYLINGQTLFRFCVFYLSDDYARFYHLPIVELHLQITLVCTCGALLSQMFGFIIQVSF